MNQHLNGESALYKFNTGIGVRRLVDRELPEHISTAGTATKIFLLSVITFSLFRYVHDLFTLSTGSQFLDFNLYYIYTDIVFKGINPFDPHIIVKVGGAQQIANYPPLFYFLMRPITFLSFHLSSVAWLILNQLFILGTGIIFFRLNPKGFSLFNLTAFTFIVANFYPLYDNNALGQTNMLILFLITLSLFALSKKRMLLAALTLAIVVHIKIQFILFLPVLFLIGLRKLATRTCIFILLGWVLSWQILGVDQNLEYFKYIFHFPRDLILWPGNISFTANITRLMSQSQFSPLVIALAYLLLAFKFMEILPRKYSANQSQLVWSLTILLVLILSPLLEIHHLTLCLLPISQLFLTDFKEPPKKIYLPIAVGSIFMLGTSTFLNISPYTIDGFQTIPVALRLIGLLGLFWVITQSTLFNSN